MTPGRPDAASPASRHRRRARSIRSNFVALGAQQRLGVVDVEALRRRPRGASSDRSTRTAPSRSARRFEQSHRSSLAPRARRRPRDRCRSVSKRAGRPTRRRWQTGGMVTLLLDSTQLEVVLSGAERALSFHKGNVIIERSTIAKVQLIDDAWTWLRGVPSPGTHLRGVIAMGTWKSAGASDFAIIRRRRPSVVIDLEGHAEFERVILTTRHGLALVEPCASTPATSRRTSPRSPRRRVAAAPARPPAAPRPPPPSAEAPRCRGGSLARMSETATSAESPQPHVRVERTGRLGRLTLDRLRAINALDLGHGRGARRGARRRGRTTPTSSVVLLDGAGDRGLCAGGDVRGLVRADRRRRAEETGGVLPRRVRAQRPHRRVPRSRSSCFADGITMGGGIGLAGHAAIRIVTERSQLAMPETRIGFTPDVGGTWLLGRAPGTPRRVPGADGRVDGRRGRHLRRLRRPLRAVRAASTRSARRARRPRADPTSPTELVLLFDETPEPSRLAASAPWIDDAFAADTVGEIVERLRARPEPEASATADLLEELVADRPRRDARRRAPRAARCPTCAPRSRRSTAWCCGSPRPSPTSSRASARSSSTRTAPRAGSRRRSPTSPRMPADPPSPSQPPDRALEHEQALRRR